MKVLLFAGAGSSVELGVSAMYHMAQGFRRHVREWEVEEEMVARLMPETSDIEDLIERLDQLCGARDPLQALGVDPGEIEGASTVQAEVEWYVQHACERLIPEHATFQWGSLLTTSSDHQLVIATTNYDRAVEMAANRLDVKLVDGFASFGRSEIAPWEGLPRAGASFGTAAVVLLKLHGSTDWYEKAGTGEAVKLRHPMPLFANTSLRLANTEDILSASLILPSREKRVTRPPYLRLSQAFLNAVDESDFAIFLGTSLRDPHIKQAALQSSEVRPTFLVNRRLSPDAALNPITQITQTASQFLISTLPYALSSVDPISVLTEHAQAEAMEEQTSLLTLLANALDSSVGSRERCKSIEELERTDVPLSNSVVESLVRDEDAMVARFGLGLVPLATRPESLLEIARSVGAARVDSVYQEELNLLVRLMDQPASLNP